MPNQLPASSAVPIIAQGQRALVIASLLSGKGSESKTNGQGFKS